MQRSFWYRILSKESCKLHINYIHNSFDSYSTTTNASGNKPLLASMTRAINRVHLYISIRNIPSRINTEQQWHQPKIDDPKL